MENTLENNGKTCDSHARRVEKLLMRVHLLAMETPLHETCVKFKQKKVVGIQLGIKSKMCNSLNNIIMKKDHR